MKIGLTRLVRQSCDSTNLGLTNEEERAIDKPIIVAENNNNDRRTVTVSSNNEYFDESFELRQEENWRNQNCTNKRKKYVDSMAQFNLTLQCSITLPIIVNVIYCRNVFIMVRFSVVKFDQ